jgi:hypothetical protein
MENLNKNIVKEVLREMFSTGEITIDISEVYAWYDSDPDHILSVRIDGEVVHNVYF